MYMYCIPGLHLCTLICMYMKVHVHVLHALCVIITIQYSRVVLMSSMDRLH